MKIHEKTKNVSREREKKVPQIHYWKPRVTTRQTKTLLTWAGRPLLNETEETSN